MNAILAAPLSIGAELSGIFESYPRLGLTRGDLDTYRSFRHLEPGLVSLADGEHGAEEALLEVLVLREQEQDVGVVSFVVQPNAQKKGKLNRFARIDLVIGSNSHRNLGVGRVLLLSVNTYLLSTFGDCLYSISCLAAHPAVEKVLEESSFVGYKEEQRNFTREELKLEGLDIPALTRDFEDKTAAAVKILNYNLRQRDGSS